MSTQALKSNHILLTIDGRKRQVYHRSDCVPTLDRITRLHTAFDSFSALLNANGGYRPSLYLGGKSQIDKEELLSLAVSYDEVQSARGDSRRVFKGDWNFATE
jgi:hypothetical protein